MNDNDDMEDGTVQEVMAFRSSEDMQNLLYRVSKTMGLDHNLTLGKFNFSVFNQSLCRYNMF